MASRPARSVVPDRLAEAKRQLRQVNVAMGRHFTLCARCAHAQGKTDRYCDAGWQLAKNQARAYAAVRRATEPSPARPVQGTLW